MEQNLEIYKLNPTIRDLFIYDTHKQAFVRVVKEREVNYHREFTLILEKQYGVFNESDYDIGEYYSFRENEDEKEEQEVHEGEMCICTKEIKNLFYITHKKTKQTYQVGCECIKRIIPRLTDEIKLIKNKTMKRNNGNICKTCKEPLLDLRKLYQRDGYCDVGCWYKTRYKMEFGKYKGRNVFRLFNSQEGKNYLEWVKDTIARDDEAFSKYPIFLEIVNFF